MNRVIYCFWFGPEMSNNRQDCLNSIKDLSGVDVNLITEKNLDDHIIEKNKIHPGFDYLSDTHKSDYLRSYFMYHYGGGYTDIKKCMYSWSTYFNLLENSDKSFTSCIQYLKDVAYKPAEQFYNKLPGVNTFIFKPKTKFAENWVNETNNKMDLIFNDLKLNPGTYHPRAITGGIQGEKYLFSNSAYPLGWNDLLGQIFHKLAFENPSDFSLDMPYPDTRNYR